ncbi:MAG: Fe2+-dependent dioxygenase [Sphingomonadaceae bacterium]
MLITIPDVLNSETLGHVRNLLDGAEWVDGNATSGVQSALAKRNLQLPENSAAAREAGTIILDALGQTPLFVAAALPLKVYPPLFNAYAGGQAFGTHIDNSIRVRPGTDFRIRSDVSATLFLADPDSYDGGELIIEEQFGSQSIKLPAGHMVLYSASSRHRVAPVTRGRRLASFFWIQSMVREAEARRTLFELDTAIQSLALERGQGDAAIIQLTGVYHNLLRRWADA